MAARTHSGSCHCGAVRFEAEVDLAAGSNRCNCSLCTKARAWFVLVKGAERVRLLEGADAQTEYQWKPEGQAESHLHYQFCKKCGVRAFGWGEAEHMGGKFYFVSVASLDLTEDELAAIPIRYADGKRGRYDQAPPHTSWM
jgi:hypothetical protein